MGGNFVNLIFLIINLQILKYPINYKSLNHIKYNGTTQIIEWNPRLNLVRIEPHHLAESKSGVEASKSYLVGAEWQIVLRPRP